MSTAADRIKRGGLQVSQRLGLFRAARQVTRRSLRILCYHGFATGDVLKFRPGLFMSPATFERRLKTLAAHGYTLMTLPTALSALDRGELPDYAAVITVDDVFQGFVEYALPLLRDFGMPATVYVTTYYSVHRAPVFRLAIRYMFWKTRETEVRVFLGDPRGPLSYVRSDRVSWERGEADVIAFGEGLPSEDERTNLARQLGDRLRVDYDALASSRVFNVVTTDQVKALASEGIDVQLHTHRHRLPEREDLVLREIADNRGVLEPLVGARLTHLCYPSGIWSRAVWPWLEQCGIQSATTCEPGLNDLNTPRLALKRILDSEELSHLRFDAEMSGYMPVVRGLATAGRR